MDSTTIRLFSDILKGVGRNPIGDGRKKGRAESSYAHRCGAVSGKVYEDNGGKNA